MKEEFAKYGLKIYTREMEHRNSDDPDDYEVFPVDFIIGDAEGEVAKVYGSHPINDVEIECEHPEECLDWGDDDECGECLLCGAQCTWRLVEEEEYEGRDEDGCIMSSKTGYRDIAEWHRTDNEGLIGKYLKELAKKW